MHIFNILFFAVTVVVGSVPTSTRKVPSPPSELDQNELVKVTPPPSQSEFLFSWKPLSLQKEQEEVVKVTPPHLKPWKHVTKGKLIGHFPTNSPPIELSAVNKGVSVHPPKKALEEITWTFTFAPLVQKKVTDGPAK